MGWLKVESSTAVGRRCGALEMPRLWRKPGKDCDRGRQKATWKEVERKLVNDGVQC